MIKCLLGDIGSGIREERKREKIYRKEKGTKRDG